MQVTKRAQKLTFHSAYKVNKTQAYHVARGLNLRIRDFFLRELIFAIVRDWFFELGINFLDFQKVEFT